MLGASPGGKSGFLTQLAGSSDFVLANEPGNTGSLHCGAILLDTPCSCWVTAQKHPEVLKLWRDGKMAD
ncbi:MAG: hypothetical protein LBS77_02310 [Desulfovibrio sp.]|nr:hypothetical protein [Desulfovibrio sp.]